MNEIFDFIKTPEGIAALGLLTGILSEIGVGIGLNIKSNRNTNKTKDTVDELKETVDDNKLRRQMKIVLQENAELKKALKECMETITRIKKD